MSRRDSHKNQFPDRDGTSRKCPELRLFFFLFFLFFFVNNRCVILQSTESSAVGARSEAQCMMYGGGLQGIRYHHSNTDSFICTPSAGKTTVAVACKSPQRRESHPPLAAVAIRSDDGFFIFRRI